MTTRSRSFVLVAAVLVAACRQADPVAVKEERDEIVPDVGTRAASGPKLDVPAMAFEAPPPWNPIPIATTPEGLLRLKDGLSSVAEACTWIDESQCAELRLADDQECTCRPVLEAASPDGSWGLLALRTDTEPNHAMWFPAIHGDLTRWTAFTSVLSDYDPSVSGISTDIELRESTTVDLLPDGEHEIVFSLVSKRSDRDAEVDQVETQTCTYRVVCTRDGGIPRCTQPIVDRWEYARDPEVRGTFEITARWAGSDLVVDEVARKGEVDTVLVERCGPLLRRGRHPIKKLLGWPP